MRWENLKRRMQETKPGSPNYEQERAAQGKEKQEILQELERLEKGSGSQTNSSTSP